MCSLCAVRHVRSERAEPRGWVRARSISRPIMRHTARCVSHWPPALSQPPSAAPRLVGHLSWPWPSVPRIGTRPGLGCDGADGHVRRKCPSIPHPILGWPQYHAGDGRCLLASRLRTNPPLDVHAMGCAYALTAVISSPGAMGRPGRRECASASAARSTPKRHTKCPATVPSGPWRRSSQPAALSGATLLLVAPYWPDETMRSSSSTPALQESNSLVSCKGEDEKALESFQPVLPAYSSARVSSVRV